MIFNKKKITVLGKIAKLIIAPKRTDKILNLEKLNIYVFYASPILSKFILKNFFEDFFNIKVESINISKKTNNINKVYIKLKKEYTLYSYIFT